jgi:CheY-like chemotaxis protein
MRRIPVVDDHLHIGQAIRTRLNQRGFRVLTADRGTSGLAALDKWNLRCFANACRRHGARNGGRAASSKSPDGAGGASLEVRRFGERRP